MKFKQLFFHIHYCNFKQTSQPLMAPIQISRTLQHHELMFFAKVKGRFTADHKTYELKDGTLLYIDSGVHHEIETDPRFPVRCFTVHFSYVRVEQIEGRWGIQEEPGPLPLHPAQQLTDYYQVEDVFKRLTETWAAKLPGYEFSSKTLLHQLWIAIAQNIRKATPNYSASLKVERVIQYMHDHIHQRIKLNQLAELVQLSPTYLSRSFKSITGYSIIELFNKMKMDKAKEMILEGNWKMKDVAGALGFSDEFYFSRMFKKSEGVSPSEFYSKNVHVV
ncbi:helix-turn-helix transcriptional regulator [Paenibacillus aestuarii]|uniref:AraC family transcriptional regulator n=1 Tax=Paenibacillus aestuarii TaxID=516965 RepID=A0ABW0K248_9BACL|nr:AraC family transcriptional regulator [Paenibacillus aestuarii]